MEKKTNRLGYICRNAGFDPAKFRVDKYGNVLYWSADPSSPLSWEVDHWFPHSSNASTKNSTISPFQESVPICFKLFLKSFRRVASILFTMQVLLL